VVSAVDGGPALRAPGKHPCPCHREMLWGHGTAWFGI